MHLDLIQQVKQSTYPKSHGSPTRVTVHKFLMTYRTKEIYYSICFTHGNCHLQPVTSHPMAYSRQALSHELMTNKAINNRRYVVPMMQSTT